MSAYQSSTGLSLDMCTGSPFNGDCTSMLMRQCCSRRRLLTEQLMLSREGTQWVPSNAELLATGSARCCCRVAATHQHMIITGTSSTYSYYTYYIVYWHN